MQRFALVPARDARPRRACRWARAARPSSTPATSAGPIGCPNLYLKVEGSNPTGSFKDRGMVVAVAKAMEEGARAIICASTGNTSASAAAYGAAAGLEVVVVLPQGKIAAGKLLQAQVAGARVLADRGRLRRGAARSSASSPRTPIPDHPVTLVNSVNPYRLEGQKTAAFEVCEDLGGAPDYLAIPVGNAGNISAYWMGFTEYRDRGHRGHRARDARLPGRGRGAARAGPPRSATPRRSPRPSASASPASGDKALAARDESGGRIDAVTDEQILAALPRPGADGGHLLRAGQRRIGGRRADARARRRHRPGRRPSCAC